jgi:NAD(P)-dependent dehydrogenase (short-subunit alcohol dehydrogenase family)
MKIQLKKLQDQVLVITGASSGIGLVTARMAAAAGAKVVLSSRNEQDLETAVEEIRQAGGQATFEIADVSSQREVEWIAQTALREYGRIDTWVNNAGVALYGKLMDTPLDDMRRLVDVIFWGVVHGSRTAVPHLSRQGGALINVASVLADRAVPLQGAYVAAKHAVKGFTDTLRMELEADGVPVSVTLVKPASIDTPLFDKARSLMEVEPQPVPPVYAPDLVARAILDCAQKPLRDVEVGGMGKAMSIFNTVAPRLTDLALERSGFRAQKTDKPLEGRSDNLHRHLDHDGGERGANWQGDVKERSPYTRGRTTLRPRTTALAALGAGAAVLAGFRAFRKPDR